MKGRHVDDTEEPAEDEGSSDHGLDCPSCDGGNLIRRTAATVQASLAPGNNLVNVSRNAKYVYTCDSCEYMEEVVRNAQED